MLEAHGTILVSFKGHIEVTFTPTRSRNCTAHMSDVNVCK